MTGLSDLVDVVIVGSGPAGATYARVILESHPAARVRMYEAGPMITQPPGRHVKSLEDAGQIELAQLRSQGYPGDSRPVATNLGRYGDPGRVAARPGTSLVGSGSLLEDMPAAAMSTNVGGMGAHWTCASPKPGKGERIGFLDGEFDELFKEAWGLLHVTQEAFRYAPLGDEVRASLANRFDAGRPPDRRVQPMPLALTVDAAGRRHWSGTDVILAPVLNDPRFEIVPEHTVVRILIEDGRVAGVLVRDNLSGESREVETTEVVVAADALRTPRLLHVSGVRPPALGHYLNDHPQVVGLAQLDEGFIPRAGERPTTVPGSVDALSGVSWIPYDEASFPHHGQIMQLDASPVPLTGLAEPWPGSIVGISLFSPKEIRFDDWVEFDETELDDAGLPAIKIHYTLTPADHAAMEAARRQVHSIIGILGEPVPGTEPVLMPSGSSLHYMGTVRMGQRDDGSSVCDSYSSVWGVRGLTVAGNGVIPAETACNPTATMVALAIRGARSIVERLPAQSGIGT